MRRVAPVDSACTATYTLCVIKCTHVCSSPSRCPAGPASTTQQELLHILRARTAHWGSSLLPASLGSAETTSDALTAATSALVQRLLLTTAATESSSTDGPAAKLVVANGVWTRGLPVQEDYAAAMEKYFQVKRF